jgi:hypothetical protein
MMKLSFYGKVIHFYMRFGPWAHKITAILIFSMLASTTLIVSVPQFSLHKAGSQISHFLPLAIAQTAVGIIFLVSLAGGVAFGLSAGLLGLLEIPIEVILKKRVYKLVKEKHKMSIDAVVRETGVLEDDLGFLMKNWIIRPMTEDIYKVNDVKTGKLKRGHLQVDLSAKELSWKE